MHRMPVVLAALGLASAAVLPAGAQEKVTLFGKTYNVVCESRAQTFKNGKAVVLPEEGNRKANLHFVLGADPSQDRLLVVAPIQQTDDLTAHQFYMLVGADANGMFTKTSAELVEFFGGNVDYTRGGRPVSVLFLNAENTGVKTDANIVVFNFAGSDALRVYDLDTMSGSFDTDAILTIPQPEENPENPDPGFPNGDFEAMAHGPNGTVLVAGRSAANDEGERGIEIGLFDPRQGKFLNVKTDLGQVTQDSPVKIDPINAEPHALVRISDNEYWMIVSDDQQGDNDFTDTQFLYRLEITFPEDLSKAAPNSLKVRVLARESLLGTPLAASDGGVHGMAVGRETANGRRLYFADWTGQICVATPQ